MTKNATVISLFFTIEASYWDGQRVILYESAECAEPKSVTLKTRENNVSVNLTNELTDEGTYAFVNTGSMEEK